jgi:UDP-N-acetylglucosamine 1-carboxyvinyltransferase
MICRITAEQWGYMSNYIIASSRPLKGNLRVSGSKNSVLPILAACLLTDEDNTLTEIPGLNDVNVMCELLASLGASCHYPNINGQIKINCSNIKSTIAPYELVNKMRASFLIMGPLLARTGSAKIPLPGGCAIGTRPVDLHLKGFAAMGAEISYGHGFVEANIAKRLIGNKIYLDFPSVGATENIMMAACLADGITILENAATEPEITDLATFLCSMGADIKGAGTDTIRIYGVENLRGSIHSIIPDRIEAGTFMVAAAITGGDVTLENVEPDHLRPVTAKLREAGVDVIENDNCIRVYSSGSIKSVDIKTLPYPGFPTDMQAQMTALMSRAEGTSIITETIFENRYMHVGELKRMGANIKIDGRTAVIEGTKNLLGAKVASTDLRAGAALILAGLAADGTTEISNIEHIERGYDRIHEKLRSLGADIFRV